MLLEFRPSRRLEMGARARSPCLVCLFLLLPIVFIAALSFGSSQWLIFPPPGWTLRWYRDLLRRSALARSRLDQLEDRRHGDGPLGRIGLARLASALMRGTLSRPRGAAGAVPDADDPAGRRACGGALCLLPADRAQRHADRLRASPIWSWRCRSRSSRSPMRWKASTSRSRTRRSCAAQAPGRRSCASRCRRSATACSPPPSSPSSSPGTRSWSRSSWRARRCRPCRCKIWATLRQDLTPVIAAASTLLVARHHRSDAAGRARRAKD